MSDNTSIPTIGIAAPRGNALAGFGELPVWLALAGMALLPFLVTSFPSLTDYPSHLARWHVMLDLDDSPFLHKFYDFHWHLVGNLGTDLLALPLGRIFGVELAGQIIAGSIVPLTLVALFLVARAIYGQIPAPAYLAVNFVWAAPFSLGFLNYTLSIALALFAFAAWVTREGRDSRAPLMALAACGIWLCHSGGWGALVLMVGGYELARTGNPIIAGLRALPTLAPLPLVLDKTVQVAGHAPLTTWNYKLTALAYCLTGRFKLLDAVCLALLLLLAAVLIARGIVRIDLRLGIPAALVFMAAMVLPRSFGGGDLADVRLFPVAGLLFFLSLRAEGMDWLRQAAIALFAARMAIVASGWHDDGELRERQVAALEEVEPGSRVLNFVLSNGSLYDMPSNSHLSGYAVIRRDALTNSNFAIPGVHMLSVRAPYTEWVDPSQFRRRNRKLNAMNMQVLPVTADYVWYMGKARALLPKRATIVYRDSESLLARIAPREG
ncbi:hypothetical protein ACFO0A_03180 [Novosphingobium tardum]|uniref:Uncharacterized protein n=1 Tax=Novosphingobium tardum TaxID=1538021 RepID=A0ABV8RMX9_9SPHN